MNIDLYRHFFKAFSNQTRLDILALLRKGPRNVTQIRKTLKVEQSRVSHNLRCLQQCGFVEAEKKGKERIYALDSENIEPLLDIVDKHIHRYQQRLKECGVIQK